MCNEVFAPAVGPFQTYTIYSVFAVRRCRFGWAADSAADDRVQGREMLVCIYAYIVLYVHIFCVCVCRMAVFCATRVHIQHINTYRVIFCVCNVPNIRVALVCLLSRTKPYERFICARQMGTRLDAANVWCGRYVKLYILARATSHIDTLYMLKLYVFSFEILYIQCKCK